MSAEPSPRQTLRQLIQEHFSLQELEDLCFDLNIDHEELGGDTLSKSTRVVRLIKYAQKHRRLPALLTQVQEARPQILWPTDLADKLLGIEPGQLVNVPLLPLHFLPREAELAALREKVLADSAVAVGITGHSKAVGVQGMGGIGKSVLAAALARDSAVRERFPDGIIWLELGQEPNLVARQVQLAQAISDELPTFADSQQGRSYLDRLLKHTTCLVVLDDVWQVNHVDAFPVMEGQNRLFITTRDARVVQTIGATEYQLDVLQEEDALQLLANKVGVVSGVDLPAEAKRIAKACGYLPLALAMIGGMIAKHRPNGWQYALERLRRADLSRVQEKFPNYPYPDLFKAIDVSVVAMGQDEGITRLQPVERYLDLAVFPEDVAIPMTVLQTFWRPLGLDEWDVADLVNEWSSRSLGRYEQGHLRLHDLQRDYVRMPDGLPQRQEQLLAAYAQQYPNGWANGPNDGYFFQYLLYHLQQAGRQDEIETLLLQAAWLRAKLEATDVYSLITDCDLSMTNDSQTPTQLLRRTLSLSAHVLVKDKKQLPGQLLGRLMALDIPQLAPLLTELKTWHDETWFRPLRGSLVTPAETLVHTLVGHTDVIILVGVSPDNRWVVSGSKDSTVKVWELSTGRLHHSLEGHTSLGHSVVVSPDNRWVVSGSWDNTVKVWELSTGRLHHSLEGHTRWVNSVVVSPDNRWVVSGSWDNTVKVWELSTGRLHHSLEGHTSLGHSVVVSPDNRWVVSGATDNTVKVWELSTGRLHHSLTGHTDWVNSVVVSPDNRWVVSGSYDKTVKVWELSTGRLHHSLEKHTEGVNSVVVSPDNRWVVSGSYDKTVKVWELSTGRLHHSLEGHTEQVTSVVVSPDNRWVVSGSNDKTVKVWELSTGRLHHSLEGHTEGVNSVVVSPDNRWVVSGSTDKTVKVWELSTARLHHSLERHTKWVNSVVVSPDNRWVVSGAWDNTVKVWKLSTARLHHSLERHTKWVNSVVVSPDNRWVVSGAWDNTVKVWKLSTGRLHHSLKGHTERVNSVGVSPDNRWVVSGSGDNTVKVWELSTGRLHHCLKDFLLWPYNALAEGKLSTGRLHHSLEGHTDAVILVVVSPDNRWVVSGSWDHTVKVWELSTGRLHHSLEGHTGWVRSVVVSPDNRWVVSGADDNTVKVWELSTGRLHHSLEGHTSWVNSVVVSPDNRWVVSGADDNTVKVWELSTGRLHHSLTGHTSKVTSVVVSPDNRWVVSGSGDNTVKVWELATGQLITTFTADFSITCLTTAPDSRTVIAGDERGQVHFLYLEGIA